MGLTNVELEWMKFKVNRPSEMTQIINAGFMFSIRKH